MTQAKETYFLELVKHHFNDILEKDGFVIVGYTFDSAHFGNARVTLQSPAFLIQLLRDRGQVHLGLGLSEKNHDIYDLAQIVSFLDPKSTWSYRSPDEHSKLYSSTEWKMGEVKRVFDKYRSQLLNSDLFTKRKRELDQFIKTKYVSPWLRKPQR